MSRPTKKRRAGGKRPAPITLSPADAIQLGIRLHQQGELEQAVKLYRHVLAHLPDHVDALHFLGIAEHQLGRSEVGLALLERAVALAAPFADLYNNYGNVLRQLGRLDAAEQAYQRALELRPEDANALNNLATILRERGALEQAAATFERVLALNPEHYEAHQNLGHVYSALQRFEEALEQHRRALLLRPRQGDGYRELGAALCALGKVEEACAIYRHWLSVAPDNPAPRHLLAACTAQDVPQRASDGYIRESFDVFASHFDTSLERLQYRAPSLVAEAVAKRVGAATSLRVLDVGCGTGLCGPKLRGFASRLIGVDLSEKMLDKARARGCYDELQAAELTAYLEGCTEAQELIVSADTLVYFGALERVAKAARRALVPAGHFVFTVERSEEDEAPQGFRIHPHGRYSHTEPYLREVLSAAGFLPPVIERVTLRMEAGRPVSGALVTAQAQ